MASYRDPPTRVDRAKAIAAVAAIHIALAALILSGSRVVPTTSGQAPIQLIDVTLPPPPPPPPPPEPAAKPDRDEGVAGKKADPSPIVLPPPRIALPVTNPLPVAPVAGSGSATSAGSATAGTGPGAGGAGSGSGGGGGAGGGIGQDARLLSGGLNRRDYRRLRDFAAPSGRAVLAILIGADGRVAQCSIRQSSGDPALDATLCAILQPRMLWAPARDHSGRPLTVGIYYTATWSRY